MPKEFINPNWHVAIMHYPLGLLMAGALIEVFSFMWRRHAFRAAGRWMILLGALTGLPTATLGLYALSDVVKIGMPEDAASGTWKQVSAASPVTNNHDQWHMLEDHLIYQAASTLLSVVVVVVWIACSDRMRRKLHIPLLLLLLAAVGMTGIGAWHGGEAVYRHGTGVQNVELAASPGEGARTIAPGAGATTATTGPTTTSAAPVQQLEQKRGVDYYVPPLQAHVMLAGFAFAFAFASLALSIRAITVGTIEPGVDHIAAVLGTESAASGPERSAADETHAERADLLRPRVPSARFWLVTALVAAVASAAGWWTLGSAADVPLTGEGMRQLFDMVKQLPRRLWHTILGGSLVILPLILALIARFAPRRKWLLTIFSVLLITSIAAQVWLGVLMLFDTVEGPISRFND